MILNNSLSNFIDNQFNMELEEALNTPVEFYMTDDTKMPREIYGAFEIEDRQYGISLIQTSYDGIYELSFYFISNKTKRRWSIKKSSDVRPCLSTVVKFFEASQAFISVKMKGVIIHIPHQGQLSERFTNFMRRIIKTSYIKTYREVPIEKTSDKAMNYMFLIKRTIQPNALFTSAKFSKHFVFDPNTQEIQVNGLEEINVPYKTIPNKVSLTPDPLLAFGKLEVNLHGEELLASLNNLKEINAINTTSIDASEGTPKFKISTTPKIDDKNVTITLKSILANMLPNAYKNIKTHGFDENKIDINNLKFAFSQSYSALPEIMKDELKDADIVDAGGDLKINNFVIKELVFKAMKAFETMGYDDHIIFQKAKDILQKSVKKSNSSKSKKILSHIKLDLGELSENIKSSVEAFEAANTSTFENGVIGFVDDIPVSERIDAIKNMPNMGNWYNNVDTNSSGFKALYRYCGPDAFDMNRELRQQVKSKKLSYDSIDNKSKNLMNYFKKEAPRLDEAIWVYRNAELPEHFDVGDEMIDPAFLSTSIHSPMSYGSEGKTRLKIFLPEGTICLPILGHSPHDSERELVLPPFSVLKVIEKATDNLGRTYYVCVYVGTAMESFMKTKTGNEIMLEAQEKEKEDKKEKYDANKKYKSFTDKETSQKLSRMIKDGKLKIR